MKFKRWFLWLAGALLGMAVPCQAQHGSHWRVYRAADGLPETYTTAITVGQHGHLWVRHPYADWVSRLTGYAVKAFPGPGLGTSRIYESASGQLWTCSIEGLQRYRDTENGWIRYDLPELNAEFRANNLNPFHGIPLLPLRQNH